jgi:hypothetical protein
VAKNSDPNWSGNTKEIVWNSTTTGTRPPGWSEQQIQGTRLPHPGSTCTSDAGAITERDAADVLRRAR